jgi:hypothetical protein
MIFDNGRLAAVNLNRTLLQATQSARLVRT